MSTLELSDEYLENIAAQFEKWAEFLNSAIGLLAFTLGLASLGTKIPWISATLSMFIVFLVRAGGGHVFPSEIERLRRASKSDKKADVIVKGLIEKHLNANVLILKYPVFLLGMLFLFSVAASPLLVLIAPFLATYYGL